MLQAHLIGHLGADVVIQNSTEKPFATLRVAHTHRYVDRDGVVHEQTTWVDVILSRYSDALLPYLRKGAQIYVSGSVELRVYSSPKDKCMKAGMTIRAQQIELIRVPREQE